MMLLLLYGVGTVVHPEVTHRVTARYAMNAPYVRARLSAIPAEIQKQERLAADAAQAARTVYAKSPQNRSAAYNLAADANARAASLRAEQKALRTLR